MTLSIIVNADDFGLTIGVNNSILACHLAGSVTSTTLMVNADATEHAASMALDYPSLGVGLHFNVTQGFPVSQPSSVQSLLHADGQFLTRKELIRRYYLGGVRLGDVVTELETQLIRMRSFGLCPTHLDSHQHVHSLPGIFSGFSAVAERNSLPVRMTHRWPGQFTRKSLMRAAKAGILHHMTDRCQRMLPESVDSNDGLCSFFDLDVPASELTQSSYLKLLDAYDCGVIELMVHPAEVDADLAAKTAITEMSAIENRLLRSDFLLKYIEDRGGKLIRYDDAAIKRSKCAA